MLRELFKQKVYDQYGHTWNDTQHSGQWWYSKESWKCKLRKDHIDVLRKGNRDGYDPTMLFHLLLYSSLALLITEIPGVQCILQAGSNIVQCQIQGKAQLSRHLNPEDEVYFDFGSVSCRYQISKVRGTKLYLVVPFDQKQVQGVATAPFKATIFRCTEEWYAVYRLSVIRNDEFAHCTAARMSGKMLDKCMKNIQEVYQILRLPQRLSKHIDHIRKGGY